MKLSDFLTTIHTFDGVDKQAILDNFGITPKRFSALLNQYGGGCLHIKNGKLVVDPEWKEVNLPEFDGHETDTRVHAPDRPGNNPDFIESGGLSRNSLNTGSNKGSNKFIKDARYQEIREEEGQDEFLRNIGKGVNGERFV